MKYLLFVFWVFRSFVLEPPVAVGSAKTRLADWSKIVTSCPSTVSAKSPHVARTKSKSLVTLARSTSRPLEERFDYLDELFLRAITRDDFTIIDGPESALYQETYELRGPTITNRLPREDMPVAARINNRWRFLVVLVVVSDNAGPIVGLASISGNELLDFSRTLVEPTNEAFIYQNSNDVTMGFTPNGEELLNRLTKAIVEDRSLLSTLDSIIARVKQFPVYGKTEHGSGRSFWLELDRRVKRALPPVDIFTADVVSSSTSWEGVEAVLRQQLKDWPGEFSFVPERLELPLGLSITWSFDHTINKAIISVKLPRGIPLNVRKATLKGHKFALVDESGSEIAVSSTNEQGIILFDFTGNEGTAVFRPSR